MDGLLKITLRHPEDVTESLICPGYFTFFTDQEVAVIEIVEYPVLRRRFPNGTGGSGGSHIRVLLQSWKNVFQVVTEEGDR